MYERIGTKAPPRPGLPPGNYGDEINSITRLLKIAGLDPARHNDSGWIMDVLERGELRATPARLADAIVSHQRLDVRARDELVSRLQRIVPVDDAAHADSFGARTQPIADWIEAIADRSPADKAPGAAA